MNTFRCKYIFGVCLSIINFGGLEFFLYIVAYLQRSCLDLRV